MISLSRTGACLEIRIDRPERRNALTQDMYTAMAGALNDAQADPQLACVLIHGAQGHFTAGNDLSEFKDFAFGDGHAARNFLYALADLDVPLIAAVEGQAVGVGVTMLLHCDHVVAARSAVFRLPFAALGLCPEGGSSLLLAQQCGARRAADWLLTARPFTAEQASQGNLISALVDDGQALEAARAHAAALQELPPAALRASKRLMKQPQRQAVRDAIDAEWREFLQRLRSDEAQAAFQRFFARR